MHIQCDVYIKLNYLHFSSYIALKFHSQFLFLFQTLKKKISPKIYHPWMFSITEQPESMSAEFQRLHINKFLLVRLKRFVSYALLPEIL